MPQSEFRPYRFRYVYEFADIIYKYVENATPYYPLEDKETIAAIVRFNKDSLLHHYIFTYLWEYHNEYYHDNQDCIEDNVVQKWIDIGHDYDVAFTDDCDLEQEDGFMCWYNQNHDAFNEIFNNITEEVFHVLFANHHFLLKFNKIIAQYLQEVLEMKTLSIPEKYLYPNGTIKHCNIPSWVKDAVFHRDHGRCVFCGADLTGQYSHLTKRNYDHIIPLHQYGVNDPCNIQTTCEHCNKSKKDDADKVPEYQYESWW